MSPPFTDKKTEKKRRTGDGQMGYLRTRGSRERAFDEEKKELKKMKDQLRYLNKKENDKKLSSKEMKTKKMLEKSLSKS